MGTIGQPLVEASAEPNDDLLLLHIEVSGDVGYSRRDARADGYIRVVLEP